MDREVVPVLGNICQGCGADVGPRLPGQGMWTRLHSPTQCLMRLREQNEALQVRVDRLERSAERAGQRLANVPECR